MKAMTCSSFRDEMTREWSGITTTRGSAEVLTRWSAAEPALARFAGLAEVVDAIAVPIGQSYDASLEIAQAVIRVAGEDIFARRLMLQVMAPILSKECFKSSQLLRAQGVVVDDSEIVTLVLGAATDAIAAVAGTTVGWPLRDLRRRTIKRITRRRERLVRNARELVDEVPDAAAPVAERSPAELLAATLDLAISKGIVSSEDARLVWASSHEGETSFSLAAGDRREAERLRRRRSRAQRRMADRCAELEEAIAV